MSLTVCPARTKLTSDPPSTVAVRGSSSAASCPSPEWSRSPPPAILSVPPLASTSSSRPVHGNSSRSDWQVGSSASSTPRPPSLPVAILIALILYVNETPDRPGDAAVGKRPLPVRWSREAVTQAFLIAALAAFAVIVGGVIGGALPLPTLIALLAVPLVFPVYSGIQKFYNSPYELMATMGKNVQLHLVTGLLLFAGYLIAVAVKEHGAFRLTRRKPLVVEEEIEGQ